MKNQNVELIKAAYEGNLNIVKDLIENGADINYIDEYCGTALHGAANNRNLEMVKYLIEKGADLNLVGLNQDTVLHDAVIHAHPEIAKYLIKHGANLDIANDQGYTALSTAQRYSFRTEYKEMSDIIIDAKKRK